MIMLVLKLITGMTPIAILLWVWQNEANALAIAVRHAASVFGSAIAVAAVLAFLALYGLRMIDARHAQRIADDRAFKVRSAHAVRLPESGAGPAADADDADDAAPGAVTDPA
jgi:hypothetical protein